MKRRLSVRRRWRLWRLLGYAILMLVVLYYITRRPRRQLDNVVNPLVGVEVGELYAGNKEDDETEETNIAHSDYDENNDQTKDLSSPSSPEGLGEYRHHPQILPELAGPAVDGTLTPSHRVRVPGRQESLQPPRAENYHVLARFNGGRNGDQLQNYGDNIRSRPHLQLANTNNMLVIPQTHMLGSNERFQSSQENHLRAPPQYQLGYTAQAGYSAHNFRSNQGASNQAIGKNAIFTDRSQQAIGRYVQPVAQNRAPAQQNRVPAPQYHVTAPQNHVPAPHNHVPAPQNHLPAPQNHVPAPQNHVPPRRLDYQTPARDTTEVKQPPATNYLHGGIDNPHHLHPTYQQQPLQRSYQQPLQRSHQQPIQRSYQQPLQRSHQQPLQRSHQQQPLQPTYNQQPLQQSYQQQLLQRSYLQPLQRSHQQPLQRSHQQPLQRSHQQQPLQRSHQQQPLQRSHQQQPLQRSYQQQPLQRSYQQQPLQLSYQQQPLQRSYQQQPLQRSYQRQPLQLSYQQQPLQPSYQQQPLQRSHQQQPLQRSYQQQPLQLSYQQQPLQPSYQQKSLQRSYQQVDGSLGVQNGAEILTQNGPGAMHDEGAIVAGQEYDEYDDEEVGVITKRHKGNNYVVGHQSGKLVTIPRYNTYSNTADDIGPSPLLPGPGRGDRILQQLQHRLIPTDQIRPLTILLNDHWPNPVPDGAHQFQQCRVKQCEITQDRSRRESVDVVLYTADMPAEKPDHLSVLLLLDSPQSLHIRSDIVPDLVASYRSDSDIVTHHVKWVPFDKRVPQQHQRTNYATDKSKKVAMFVSHCPTANRRLQYAEELAEFIEVDIFGTCGTKRCVSDDTCLKMLANDYKFFLAFENSNCREFITEIFFTNSLNNSVLPVVMGSAPEDYRRVAPPHSFIHVDQFQSPQHLAEYLHVLDSNDTAYNEYFSWRDAGRLVDTHFFCRLCAMVHETRRGNREVRQWWNSGTCTDSSWGQHPV